MSKNQSAVNQTMTFQDAVNPGPFGSVVTNAGLMHSSGDAFAASGVINPLDPNSPQVDDHTLSGEGSIGKVRFAGLAYMLQQSGIIDLQANARDFFASPEMRNFLQIKYPDQAQALQEEIGKFFFNNDKAKLVDLTTHHSGVGDLTRDQAQLIKQKGIEYQYSLPELLIIPPELQVIPRDKNGKLRAQSGGNVANQDLPLAEFGKHQYSNLGFALLGLAMEAAYYQTKGELKTYQQLTDEFMLHPLQGRAVREGLSFDETKFSTELVDNCFKPLWVEGEVGNEKLADVNKFVGANAAGGMFASASDSKKFFQEYFKGFPGTVEFGQNINPFFSPETIAEMQEEWQKHPPANQSDIDTAKEKHQQPTILRFQGAGYTVDYPYDQNYYSDPQEFFAQAQPTKYTKTGGTFGYNSRLDFDPKAKEISISMIAQENITGLVASQMLENSGSILGESTTQLAGEIQKLYQDSKGNYDRAALMQDKTPQLLEVHGTSQNRDVKGHFTEAVLQREQSSKDSQQVK
jgi:CubicO group peptidase (beta-lactamase class C family)